jgi:hypothetical protein
MNVTDEELNVTDEEYSRNTPCALNLISSILSIK